MPRRFKHIALTQRVLSDPIVKSNQCSTSRCINGQLQLAISPSAVVAQSGRLDDNPDCELCANVATASNPRRKPTDVSILAIAITFFGCR